MNTKILDVIDFEKVNTLLEGFNKSTGFVTAILDLEGNVLSKSGWRQICTQFHRIHPETSKKCTISDTELANKMGEGEKYHFYKCLNGLVDVAVPVIINGEHIANLFSGQFFFEEPDVSFFKKQAEKYGFDEKHYLELLAKVPVVSKEKVIVAMDFLLDMTHLISEMTFQKLEQMELNQTIQKSEQRFRIIFENSLAVMLLIEPDSRRIIAANHAAEKFYGWKRSEIETMRVDDINTLTPAEIKVEMDKARKSERIYFRFKHRLASGQIRDVEIYSSKVEIDGKDYLHSIVHDVTEQVKAEEALKNNERVLRLFVEHSPASIAMFDNQMRYMVYSKRFLADYDLNERNIIGLSHYEVFPEIPQRWKDIHQRGLNGEILSDDNDLFPRANGKTDWVRWEIHPWYKNENEIGGIILFSEVITERKKSADALRESEAYNRMLFEQSQMGLALADMDGKLVDINPAYAKIIGRSIEEAKQLTYWDITPEKYATQEKEQLELLEKTGRYGPYEKEYIHKDGNLVPVRLQGLMIKRDGQKFIWSSVEDISEQKKAELDLIAAKEEIEASEQVKTELLNKLNEAQHNAKIGSWEWDLATGHVWWSDELYRIFELDPDKFTPGVEANARYVHPDDNEAYHKEVALAIQKKEELNVDLRIISGMGNLKYCNSRAVLDYDETGNPVKMSGTFADISARKLVEQEKLATFNLLKNLADQVPGVVYQYRLYPDGSSAFPYSSPGIWDIYEVTPEEVREDASPVFTRIHPDDYNYILETITESAKNQTNYESEFRVILPKQGLRWRYCNAKPQLLEDGSTLWHGIITDITERQLAEEARQKSEEQYRTLFETMTQGVVYQRANGEIISANQAAEKILGLSIDQMMGRTSIDPRWKAVDEMKNPLPGEKHPAMVALQTGKEVHNFTQGIFNPKINEYVWILVNSIPQFKVGEKKPFQVFSTFLDITERKNAEEELHASEERFRAMVEGAPDPIFIQTDNRFSFLNKPALKLFGANSESELLGKPVIDRIHPDFHQSTKERIKQLNENQQSVAQLAELKFVTLQGDEVWVETSGEPIFYQRKHGGLVFVRDVTERKNAEDKLRESESRFRKLYEDGANGMVMASKDFKFIMANRTFCQMTGYTEEELQQLTFTQITHPDDRDKDISPVTKMLRGEIDVYRTEKKYIKKDGKNFWAQLTVSPIYNSNGQFLYFVGIIVNVTERKKAEEALSHSHDLMKYIIEHNQTSVAVLDKNLSYLYVSQRFLSEYRLKEKNIIGKHHYEVFPEIPEKWRKIHQMALKGIVSKSDEDMFYRNDGTFDWTRWECRPWYEADGSIGGIILYLEVISEQKKKEKEIIKLNQRLEILIGSVQQLAAALSLETVQDIVAKSARKLIGADGATLVLRENDNCFYVNEDAIQPLWKGKKFPMKSCISGWVMENKKSVVIEDIFVDDRIPKDAYSPTFVKSLAMVPVNISEPIGAIGNYWKEPYSPTEIEMQLLQTLADAAARAIENIQLYAELEDRVKRRTDQLNAANKELETFTYSVSHDLKAPLRGIDGYSKLLLHEYGDKFGEEATHFIHTIRSATLQMNQLIEDLLSYSRLERSHFKQEKIALRSFTETLVSNFSEEIKKDRFEVEINIPGVEIVTDSTGLSIILRNFIENAIKFTREKPNPRLEINFSENPETWTIAVKDNGVGFDMKYHDRIFEIFQRLHRAEDFPGTGIGLAMVQKAAQRMNGKTHAESVQGKGSAFFIEIQKNKSI